MKKLIIAVICIILVVALVGCRDKKGEAQVVTPEVSYAVITFVVDPELYIFEAPEPITVAIGSTPTLPFPEGAVPMDTHDDLAWFADETLITPYDTTRPVMGDMTLYLYEVGKHYSVRYEGLDGFDVRGEYVYDYQYSEYGEGGAELPTVHKEGYYDGLYCVELGVHCVRIPTNAGRDLTFTVPKPRAYGINYDYGEDVNPSDVTNPNPATYDRVGETLTLAPASANGRQFDCWIVKVWTTPKTFVVDGETVRLTLEGTVVTRLSYEMIQWGYQNFTVVAQWK